jgi:cytochrome oxidase Cu insertion factor (SCO1/SenC/PrrC family)
MEESGNKKTSSIIAGLLTVVVLIIFPAGTWFYLQSGLAYRNAAKAELMEQVKISGLQLENQNNQLITEAALHGKVGVIHFLPAEPSRSKAAIERLQKVFVSFEEESDDFFFLNIVAGDSSTNLLQSAKELGIGDNKRWYLVKTTQSQIPELAKQVFHLPDLQNSVALSDTSATIRKYYDLQKNEDMGRLIEHLGMLLPKKKKR